MRVLVCGGRDYGCIPANFEGSSPEWHTEAARAVLEQDLLMRVLDGSGATVIIHGEARGADHWANFWAIAHDIAVMAYPACWYPKGRRGPLDRSAGPKRNQRMIAEGKPDLVIAFPGGRGTSDMVKRAKAAGIPVQEAPPRSSSLGEAL